MKPLLTALLLLSLSASAFAELGCLERSKFPYLHKYIGSYETNAFMSEKAVSSKLQALVGKDLALVQRNLEVRGPIDLISCDLSVSGNAPHGGLDENAIVNFDLATGEIIVAVRSDSSKGEITVYSSSAEFITLPFSVKLWVFYINGSLSSNRTYVPINFRKIAN